MNKPYIVREMPRQIAESTATRLADIETATIGHLKSDGFMHPRIAARLPGARVAGTAVTVSTHGMDSTAVLIALDAIRKRDFLIIDRCGNQTHAALGVIMATAFQRAGGVGIIVDGPITDLPDILRIGLPVWCTGVSPLLGRKLNHGGTVNCPISCGDVAVQPGMTILADDSGVVCMEENESLLLAGPAKARQDGEVELLRRINNGERLSGITGAPRFSDYVSPGN